MNNHYPFVLVPLNYPYDALEPCILSSVSKQKTRVFRGLVECDRLGKSKPKLHKCNFVKIKFK